MWPHLGICGPSGSDRRLGAWKEGAGGGEETLSPVHHSETQHTMSGNRPKWPFVIMLGGPNPQTKSKQAKDLALQTSGGQEPEACVERLSFLETLECPCLLRRLRRAGTSNECLLQSPGSRDRGRAPQWLVLGHLRCQTFTCTPLGSSWKKGVWASPLTCSSSIFHWNGDLL